MSSADHPGTHLWWEWNGKVIERSERLQDGVLSVGLHLASVTRDELNSNFKCYAQNADVTDPVTASVVVKMHLPPLSVEIRVNNNLNFEAGQPRVVDCVVVGCVPPPAVTWHLGDDLLRSSVHKELHDGNFTVSSLTLVPSLRDDKRELVCRVQNSHLPGKIFEDEIVLSVGFRPTTKNHEEVVGYMDGQAESVTCTVDAYPEPMQFTWTFPNSKTLYTSVQKVPGHQHRFSSSLTWKPSENDQGHLLCRANNVFGEQKNPCIYTIVAGGPPMTPDCEFTELYPDTYKVSCKKSWDGGRPQTIHLEIQNISGTTVQKLTDKSGHFSLPSKHEQNLTAVIYASNSRGRSEPLILSLTMDLNHNISNGNEDEKNEGYYLVFYTIIGVTSVIGSLMGLLAYCLEYLEKSRRERREMADDLPMCSMNARGTYHREPPLQLVTIEQNNRATIAVPCDRKECLDQCPSQTKAGRLLGFGHPVVHRDSYYV